MDYLEQVQRGIDFIETNLDNDISLSQVANAAAISQWHFQRIFKALTNETLKTYIRSRRMANALDKLLSTDLRIIDIAVSAGFESQESFTRAFKQAFTMTPNQYRQLGDNSLFLKKIQFDSSYLEHIKQSVSLEPEIYQQDAMQLVGMNTLFYSVDSEKNNIAEQLPPLWDVFLKRMNEIKHSVGCTGYGVIQQTKEQTDQLEYYAALEVSQLGEIPEGMVSIEIPTATYAKFTHKGAVKNLDNTVNYIYSSWLLQSSKQSNYQHSYGADIEIYGADYHPVSDESVIHYAIPVRQVLS